MSRRQTGEGGHGQGGRAGGRGQRPPTAREAGGCHHGSLGFVNEPPPFLAPPARKHHRYPRLPLLSWARAPQGFPASNRLGTWTKNTKGSSTSRNIGEGRQWGGGVCPGCVTLGE